MDVYRYIFAVANNSIGTDSVRTATATSFINNAVGFIYQTASPPSVIAVAVVASALATAATINNQYIFELAIASSGARS